MELSELAVSLFIQKCRLHSNDNSSKYFKKDNDAYVKFKWIEADLEFHYYNESPINPGSRKPHFNILLDDSAGLKEALDLFVSFLDYLDSLDI